MGRLAAISGHEGLANLVFPPSPAPAPTGTPNWAAVEQFIRRRLYDIDSRMNPGGLPTQLPALRREAADLTRGLRRLIGDLP